MLTRGRMGRAPISALSVSCFNIHLCIRLSPPSPLPLFNFMLHFGFNDSCRRIWYTFISHVVLLRRCIVGYTCKFRLSMYNIINPKECILL